MPHMKRHLRWLPWLIATILLMVAHEGFMAHHYRIAMDRVRAIGIVADQCEVKLIYYSGFRRENDFVYSTPRSCLKGTEKPFNDVNQYVPGDGEFAGSLFYAHEALAKAVPGIQRSDYLIRPSIHSETSTLYYVVLPLKGDDAYVILTPF